MAPIDPSHAPRFTNLADDEVVFNRVLLVEGCAGPQTRNDASILVYPDHSSGFPPETWEVNDGFFKALVPLTPGTNTLTFVYCPTRSPPSSEKGPDSRSDVKLRITYDPRPRTPPLHLAILVASDSPALINGGKFGPSGAGSSPPMARAPPPQEGVRSLLAKAKNRLSELDIQQRRGMNDPQRAIVDAPPGPRREALRNGGVDEVMRRVAIQAYLWQAFTAEQMRRHGLGRRAFRLDDGHTDPAPGAAAQARRLESMPRIHILRSRRTVREIRLPDNAQQKKNASHGGAMMDFAQEALSDPSLPPLLRQSPIAVLILDSTWDASMQLLRGHAAIGMGGPGRLSLGVMGSHWLWSAPSSLSDVTRAFLDEEQTDETCCVNDLRECGTAWETLNIGSGAWMHEVGHALNNPHWPSGVMARGYVEFNRAFMTREGRSSRTGSRGVRPINSNNDSEHNHLHRCQAIRARWHPTFHCPSDPSLPNLVMGATDAQTWNAWCEAEPHWAPTPSGVSLSCSAGIAAIEIEVDGHHRTHIEWTNLPGGNKSPNETLLSPAYLNNLLSIDALSPHAPRIKLNALGCNMRQAELADYRENGIAQVLRIPGSSFRNPIFKGTSVGTEQGEREKRWMEVWPHCKEDLDGREDLTLRAVVIHSGASLDGITFQYSSGRSVRYGPCRGGLPFNFPIPSGDSISHFIVRSGAWVDAIEIVLASGRSSGMRGGNGGGIRVLKPPSGEERIVGLWGSSGAWIDQLGILTQKVAGG